MARHLSDMEGLFKALADATRLRILGLLLTGWLALPALGQGLKPQPDGEIVPVDVATPEVLPIEATRTAQWPDAFAHSGCSASLRPPFRHIDPQSVVAATAGRPRSTGLRAGCPSCRRSTSSARPLERQADGSRITTGISRVVLAS